LLYDFGLKAKVPREARAPLCKNSLLSIGLVYLISLILMFL